MRPLALLCDSWMFFYFSFHFADLERIVNTMSCATLRNKRVNRNETWNMKKKWGIAWKKQQHTIKNTLLLNHSVNPHTFGGLEWVRGWLWLHPSWLLLHEMKVPKRLFRLTLQVWFPAAPLGPCLGSLPPGRSRSLWGHTSSRSRTCSRSPGRGWPAWCCPSSSCRPLGAQKEERVTLSK